MYQKPAKKSLGQHFLTNPYYVDQLLHAIAATSDDYVVEIGPGSGCLTQHLLGVCQHLLAVELDADCVQYLRAQYGQKQRFEVVHADFLAFDLCDLPRAPSIWVGNLPYNVSVPILLRFLDLADTFSQAVFLVQKEVAQRCYAQAGDRHYGRLGVVLQCVFDIQLCFAVPPEAFSPPPKVDSAVIRLTRKEKPRLDYLQHPQFQAVLTRCFGQRRKMLRKIFQGMLQPSQWEALGIDSQLRPEQVSVDEFYQIACALAADSQ